MALLPLVYSCEETVIEDDPTYGTLSVESATYSADALSSSAQISITSDSDWKVELLEESTEWISTFTETGTGNGTVVITFPMNTGYQARTAYFRVSLINDVVADPVQFELTQQKRSSPITVADVFSTDLNTSVYLENVLVVGTFENGFLGSDETGVIAVEIMNSGVSRGDMVSLSGHSARYHASMQIDALAVVVTSSGNEVTLPQTLETLTDANLKGFMSSDTVQFISALVDVVSTTSLKGREEFSSPWKTSFTCFDAAACLDTLTGKSAKVEGYVYGNRDGNAYIYVLSAVEYVEPSYFSIDKNSFSDISYNGETLSFKITSNVDWTITCPEGVTVVSTTGKGSGSVSLTVLKNDDTVIKDYTVTVSTLAPVDAKELSIAIRQVACPSRPDPVKLSLTLTASASTWPFESPKLSALPTSDSSIGNMKGDQVFKMPVAKGGYQFTFHATDGMKCHATQGLCFGKQKGDKLDLPAINKLKLVKINITFGYKNNSCSYVADSKGTVVKGGEATAKGITAGTTYTWNLTGSVDSEGYSIVLNPSSAGLMHISKLELFYE